MLKTTNTISKNWHYDDPIPPSPPAGGWGIYRNLSFHNWYKENNSKPFFRHETKANCDNHFLKTLTTKLKIMVGDSRT